MQTERISIERISVFGPLHRQAQMTSPPKSLLRLSFEKDCDAVALFTDYCRPRLA